MSLVQIPLRLTTGAFILNSGIGKLGMPAEAAEGVRDAASRGIPALKDLTPEQFKTFITASEIGIGSALLLPMVPGWVAGTALSAFSSGLMSMYLNTPEMTEDDGIRPSQDGISLAKDVWMLGAGVGIVLDDLLNSSGRKRRRAARRAKKISAAKQQKVEAIQQASEDKVEAIAEARKKFAADRKDARAKQLEVLQAATKQGKKMSKRALKTADKAAKKAATTLGR